jgi:small conductance mechanosensitive channel
LRKGQKRVITEILRTLVLPVALRILLAFLVFLIGRWLAKRSQGWLTDSLQKTALTESFVTLIKALSYYTIMILTVVVVLAILGVPIELLAGSLGVVLIVLSITLRTSLGNLAATVNFLLFKPFEVGDVIEAGGRVGVVHEIQLFDTVLISPDSKTHVLPNGLIQGSGLTNYSKAGILRIDLSFRISYDSDIDKAKEILTKLLKADARVIPEPPAQVFVQQLAEGTIELVAWPFVKVEDYGTLQPDFVERVKNEFDTAGIVIPLPQQDVHLFTHN